MLEQLNGPIGIVVAIVVALIVLWIVRKILSVIFLGIALVLGGWGAALAMGWDVPYVIPGKMTETLNAAREAASSFEADVVAAPTSAPAAPPPPPPPAGRASAPAAAEAMAAAPESSAAGAMADSVRTAQIRYNAPETMQLNMPIDLRLAIDATGMTPPDELFEGLEGEVRGGEAELTPQVTATLTGSGFDIRPLKPARQVLPSDRAATWQWEVTPRSEGRRTLILDVFAHPGGGDAAASVREFRDEIEVQVSTLSKVLAFAQSADPLVGFSGGALSFVLAGVTFLRRVFRRR